MGRPCCGGRVTVPAFRTGATARCGSVGLKIPKRHCQRLHPTRSSTYAEAVPVPAGDAFTARQIDEMVRAVEAANKQSGLRFSVFIGLSESDPTVYAERLLAALGDEAPQAVQILVDPANRQVEIVTG